MRRAACITGALLAAGALVLFLYHNMFDVPVDQPMMNGWLLLGVCAVLFGIALTLAIAALSDNIYRVKNGEVVSKHFEPAHDETTPMMYIPTGSVAIFMPASKHCVPDAWSLLLKRDDGREGWVDVTEDFYARTSVGEHVDLR